LQLVVTVRQCQAVHQCHTHLLTYYATGTRVPDKLPDGYSGNELPDNSSPRDGDEHTSVVHGLGWFGLVWVNYSKSTKNLKGFR